MTNVVGIRKTGLWSRDRGALPPKPKVYVVLPPAPAISQCEATGPAGNVSEGEIRCGSPITCPTWRSTSSSRSCSARSPRRYGNFDIILDISQFFNALCHHPRAVCYALIGAHAHRMLVGACNPMLCPIHVFRSARTVWSTSGPLNSNQDLDPCHGGRDSHLRCWKINTVPRPGINDLRGEAADLAVWLDGILGGPVALLSVCI